jgi:hypothetical protein
MLKKQIFKKRKEQTYLYIDFSPSLSVLVYLFFHIITNMEIIHTNSHTPQEKAEKTLFV